MARFAALLIGIGALAAGASYFPGVEPVVDRLEYRFLFNPDPVAAEWLIRSPFRQSGVEEVRLATPDGVMLHGWLKRPARLRPGERYPLVIVYSGVRRDLSPGSGDFAEPAIDLLGGLAVKPGFVPLRVVRQRP